MRGNVKSNPKFQGGITTLPPQDCIGHFVRLLLDDRRTVDSEHSSLRSRRRQAQSTSVRSRRKRITRPFVSMLDEPET